MNSSILDVDELLRDDSFMPLEEDEVLNTATYYLKQWKERAEELESNSHHNEGALNATVTIPDTGPSAPVDIHAAPSNGHRFIGMNPKLVDTRTFTRPKKQQFQPPSQRPFLNETMLLGGQSPKNSSGINLQIGGLVTTAGRALNGGLPITMTQSSMQKSLIGDTSPPSSICSSTIDLGAERLMAGSCNETYMNGGGDKGPSSLNGYNMEDVKREIEMLQNLTFDEMGGGASPEVIDATILINRDVPVNATFDNAKSFLVQKRNSDLSDIQESANGTFDLIGEEGGTCGIIGGQTILLGVEEEEEQNSTFNLTKLVKVEQEAEGENKDTMLPAVAVEEDEIHLEFGRGLDSFIQSTPICRDKAKQNDIFNFSPTGNDHMYRTIEMNMKNNAFKVPQLPQRFMDRGAPLLSTTTDSSSVTATEEEKEVIDEKTLVPESQTSQLSKTILMPPVQQLQQQNQQLDDELQSSPEYEDVPELRQKGGVPVDMLRPEERQSLVNFEEYEKSLQLLDDNRNEREFDDMLASITTTDMRRSTEKMRQSLDSIKKRHSLINYERQQEELRRKVNDIDQEINNLTMEGSGSGPRLLNRRSRLFDEQQEQQQQKQTDNVMNRTMDLNTAATLQESPGGVSGERRAVPEKRDRDRFKTIKIFRKSVNSNIPDADETSIEGVLEDGGDVTKVIDNYGMQEEEEEEEEPVKIIVPPQPRALQRPSRILARPKFGSGLQRPSHLGVTAQKASSADDLLDSRRGEGDEEEEGHRDVSPERGQSVQRMPGSRMTTGKLKSPMGIKSKSIHNLMHNGSAAGGMSRIGGGRMSAQQEMRPFSTNTFKVSKGAGGGVVASSGYASGNFQRPSMMAAKSTTGVNMRQAKSIGGVQRPVSAVLPQSAAMNRQTMDSYHDGGREEMNIPAPKLEPRLAAPRASGLRPPSGIARPTGAGGVRSGLPRFNSGIPRR